MGHRKVETTPPNNEYVALQNYHAEGNGELSITKGDVVDGQYSFLFLGGGLSKVSIEALFILERI